MPRLKPISKEALPAALQKAERYRLINQSWAAESICLDALAVDPTNQELLVTLLLALTDQFPERGGADVDRARKLLPRLSDEYKRAYYAGIISERRAKAQLDHGGPGASGIAYHALHEAMDFYEKAEASRPGGDDEALLRYNTCVRLLERYPQLQPPPEEHPAPNLGE
jgi:hypothetical protein